MARTKSTTKKPEATEVVATTITRPVAGASRATGRPKRVPLHAQRVLNVENKDPNYHYRVVNEDVGRVNKFLTAGWELVTGDVTTSEADRVQDASQMGSVVRRVVNKSKSANSNTAVLMRIPNELYEEDQAAKQRENDKIEASYDPEKFKNDPHTYGSMTKKYT